MVMIMVMIMIIIMIIIIVVVKVKVVVRIIMVRVSVNLWLEFVLSLATRTSLPGRRRYRSPVVGPCSANAAGLGAAMHSVPGWDLANCLSADINTSVCGR